jgi:hypothetical protein
MHPYSAVPQQLKDIPNWVGWKHEVRDGKPTKIPYNINSNGSAEWAKTNDPTTWTNFKHAVEASDVLNGSDYDGIGVVFTDDFQGGDLDGAVQTINNVPVINPFALSIAKLANTYCEYSPSRTGIHLIWESPIPLPEGRKKGNHTLGGEIYDKSSPRYFTVSGDKVPGLSTASITKITDPNRIKLIHFLVLNTTNEKFVLLWTGAWQKATDAQGKPFPSQSEADLALCHILVRGGFNSTETLDAAFQQSGLMRDEWKRTSKYAIAKALNGHEEAASSTTVKPTAAIEFHTPALPDPDGEYVAAPLPDRDDGWFPLGDISLIGGASGTGKTSWVFDLLHKQKQGWPVHEHRTHGRLFHVLAYDRRKNSFTRTMRRLKLLPSDIPTTPLPLAFGREAVQSIINEIEKLNPTPSIVLLEGLDMLIDDANKKSTVSPFMRQLQEVAAHFHIALIGSVGAPKTKRGEGYAAKRDKLSGSEAWGRNCETVVVIEFSEDDDGTDDRRELTILPRNAKAEKFSLEFQNGRLVVVQPETRPDVIFKPKRAREITWFKQQAEEAKTDVTKEWFTVTDFVEALEVPQSTAAKHIADALTKGFIKIKTGPKVTKWAAEQYQWNESDSNSLWVTQQAQGEVGEATLLSF